MTVDQLSPSDFSDPYMCIVYNQQTNSYYVITVCCDENGRTSFDIHITDTKEEAQRYLDYNTGKITYKEYYNPELSLSHRRKPIVCATCGTAIFFYEDKETHQIALCPKCDPHTSVIDKDGTKLTPVVH